jgi:hypothetical protein
MYWTWERSRLRNHKGLSRDEFVSYFSQHEVSPDVSAGVYDHFRKMRGIKGFFPSPSDSIEGIYGMLSEDLHDELPDILGEFGWAMPSSAKLAEWPSPVDTLEDVVRLVDWVRRKQYPS